eukprot:scaffold6880_cov110-Isochrysis_galbana.AAC.25
MQVRAANAVGRACAAELLPRASCKRSQMRCVRGHVAAPARRRSPKAPAPQPPMSGSHRFHSSIGLEYHWSLGAAARARAAPWRSASGEMGLHRHWPCRRVGGYSHSDRIADTGYQRIQELGIRSRFRGAGRLSTTPGHLSQAAGMPRPASCCDGMAAANAGRLHGVSSAVLVVCCLLYCEQCL